jgi:hypothetical protein
VTRFLSVFRGPNALTPANASDVREGVADLAGSIMWLKTTLFDTFAGAEQIIVGRSGNQLEVTGHGLPSNTAVRIFATSGGSIPGGLSANTVYYVRVIDADHIELSASSGPGAAVTITADGSGDQWIQTVPDWISTTLVSNATYGSGLFKNLVMWLAGPQTVGGAKTFDDITVSGTNKYKTASRSVARALPGMWMRTSNNTVWRLPLSAAVGTIFEATVEFPHGQILSALHVRAARTGLSGVFPTQKMRVSVIKTAILTGTETNVLAPTEDPESDIGVYETTHTIDFSGIAHTIDAANYTYTIRFEGELSPDGQSCSFKSVWADVTSASVGHWS